MPYPLLPTSKPKIWPVHWFIFRPSSNFVYFLSLSIWRWTMLSFIGTVGSKIKTCLVVFEEMTTSGRTEVWMMWPGKTSGFSGLSYIRVQSFAVRSTPDLSATFLPHGCFPSLTKVMNVSFRATRETFLAFTPCKKVWSSSTRRVSILSCLQVAIPALLQCHWAAIKDVFKCGIQKTHRWHFISTTFFPHLLRLSGIGKTLWIEFIRNFKSSCEMEYFNELQLRSDFRKSGLLFFFFFIGWGYAGKIPWTFSNYQIEDHNVPHWYCYHIYNHIIE